METHALTGIDYRTTLASTITSRLRQSILRGELQPGAKLQVDVLREHFSVSLSPVREALSRLGSAGLVEIEDQRGYRVAAVSTDNLAEVIKLRVEMESLALRQSIANADDHWRSTVLTTMDRLINHSNTCGGQQRDEEWERLHREFHLALLAGCDMPMLLAFIDNLHDLSDRYRRLFLLTNPPDRNVSEEHKRICEAVLSEDADLACALIRQHIRRTGSNVLEAISGQRPQ